MKSLSLQQKTKYFDQLVEAMIYLLQVPKQPLSFNAEELEPLTEVYHRDLKPANILIKNDNLKLGDFGCSKQFDQELNTVNGTAYYMSYELHKAKQNKIKYDQQKNDVWAGGVILYEMFYGKLPFYSNNQLNFHLEIEKKQLNSLDKLPQDIDVPLVYKLLIINMLQLDPSTRFTWKQVRDLLIKQSNNYNDISSYSNSMILGVAAKSDKAKVIQEISDFYLIRTKFKIDLFMEIYNNQNKLTFWNEEQIGLLLLYLFESISLMKLFQQQQEYEKFLLPQSQNQNYEITELDVQQFVQNMDASSFQEVYSRIQDMNQNQIKEVLSKLEKFRAYPNSQQSVVQVQKQLKILLKFLKYPLKKKLGQIDKETLALVLKIGWVNKNEAFFSLQNKIGFQQVLDKLNGIQVKYLIKNIEIYWELKE